MTEYPHLLSPLTLGHEFAGVVVDTGGHPQFTSGQAVCVCPQFACGHCEYCIRGVENLCRNLTAMGYEIDGAFAEYVRIPARGVAAGNVFAMPEGLAFETASLAEPLACVTRVIVCNWSTTPSPFVS